VTQTQFIPDRGQVIWLSFDPRAGHEQGGRRPALVLSPAAYNGKVGLVLVCPITSRVKNYPFEVALPAGLPVSGAVLADQLRNLDWRERKASYFCQVPERVLAEVLGKLEALLFRV